MKFWLRRFVSDKQALLNAFEEVVYVSVFSLAPLFLLAIIDALRGSGGETANLFFDAVAGGELYLYSFAMFGTLFYLCQKDYEHIERFPPRKWFALVILLPLLLIMCVYILDPSLRRPLASGFIKSSIVVYLLYICIYFILTVFDNLKAPDVQEELQEGADQLVKDYNKIEGA